MIAVLINIVNNNGCKSKCNEKVESAKKIIDMKNSAKFAKKPYLIDGQSKDEKVSKFLLSFFFKINKF
jgi:hypothetical protein